jgi:hypothetical protein
MEKEHYHLVKKSVAPDASIEICTYENLHQEGMKFITYKNNKPIAWSSNLSGAIENHDLIAGIHCGMKTNPFFQLISKTRLY